MLIFFAPNAIYCTKSYREIATKELEFLSDYTRLPIVSVEKEHGHKYPNDILLNTATVGNRLFCLPSHTASEILQTKAYEICAVKQGYAKCATLPITSNALITEDSSIATVAKNHALEVLQIHQNGVVLPGYSCGFLGGCASFSPYRENDRIFFCGDLSAHPNADEIIQFCKKHRKEPISLGKIPLTDVGTIFLL